MYVCMVTIHSQHEGESQLDRSVPHSFCTRIQAILGETTALFTSTHLTSASSKTLAQDAKAHRLQLLTLNNELMGLKEQVADLEAQGQMQAKDWELEKGRLLGQLDHATQTVTDSVISVTCY